MSRFIRILACALFGCATPLSAQVLGQWFATSEPSLPTYTFAAWMSPDGIDYVIVGCSRSRPGLWLEVAHQSPVGSQYAPLDVTLRIGGYDFRPGWTLRDGVSQMRAPEQQGWIMVRQANAGQARWEGQTEFLSLLLSGQPLSVILGAGNPGAADIVVATTPATAPQTLQFLANACLGPKVPAAPSTSAAGWSIQPFIDIDGRGAGTVADLSGTARIWTFCAPQGVFALVIDPQGYSLPGGYQITLPGDVDGRRFELTWYGTPSQKALHAMSFDLVQALKVGSTFTVYAADGTGFVFPLAGAAAALSKSLEFCMP